MAEDSCIAGLLECHARIRHYTEVARKLGDAESYPLAEVAAAAANLNRYFTVALPLHEADENESVDPRVQRCVPAEHLAKASASMVIQHQEINDVLRRLIATWDVLQREPERFGEFAVAYRHDAAQLEDLFHVHLELEEQVVYPAMRQYIPGPELAAIHAEMRARRS